MMSFRGRYYRPYELMFLGLLKDWEKDNRIFNTSTDTSIASVRKENSNHHGTDLDPGQKECLKKTKR